MAGLAPRADGGAPAPLTLGRLVFRNATRRPVRSGLLVLFTGLSVFIGCMLRSIVTTLDDAITGAASNRLTIQSAVSAFAELPASYRDALVLVPGVESVGRWSWFAGIYQDPKNFFPRIAVDLDVLFHQYPEIEVPKAQQAAVLADRRACLVGYRLAEEYGFRIGDTIPLLGTTYPRPDGKAWEFVVRGIYRPGPDELLNPKVFFFHWDYLDEGRRDLPEQQGVASRVTFYMVRIAPGFEATGVASAIDARYAGGPTRTHTQTEAAFRAERISSLGNVNALLGWIGAAVLFAVALSVGNAMAMAAAERSRETGIALALGFSPRTVGLLVVLESALLTGAGGLLGVLGAVGVAPVLRRAVSDVLPIFRIRPETLALGVLGAVVLGVGAGLLPAIRQARLRPVDVLRRGE